MAITHNKVATFADQPGVEINKAEWNDSHSISLTKAEFDAACSDGNFLYVGDAVTAVTVANEATDTTCFPLFVTAATGDLAPKSNATLTLNSSTGALGTAAHIITANAAAALAVGQNGTTNPAFRVTTNAFTPAVNGIDLVARPAGSGVIFNVISSFATEALTFNSKGAADITFNAGNTNNYQVSGVTRFSVSATNYNFTGLTALGTVAPKLNYVAPSGDASITASTNAPNVRFNMSASRVHSTGALTLQTDFLIDASDHRFNGASAVTDMATVAINGAPIAGNNNTTTNTSTIYSAGQNVISGTGACTNSYGLNISANTGATNNYVAKFGAGVTQNATTTIGALIAAATAGAGARSIVSDALAPVFGAAVAAGGAVVVPVYSDGANWMVG